ncbi:DgyrCDS14119 [Dimorphilus gyrociliatus]|uniref:DgyrCDS14119 n=1 Tax=Dimorphilus gyrociliatus TaxID=2664684 RepID=A0A7I8WCM3_9ANNE|nr:DgyrCDS14119 [Dimorphilus gyrociliatus]
MALRKWRNFLSSYVLRRNNNDKLDHRIVKESNSKEKREKNLSDFVNEEREPLIEGKFHLHNSSNIDLEDCYNTKGQMKGRIVIVSNTHFEKKEILRDRTGSHWDCRNISEIFTTLGYDVEIWNNCTKPEFEQKLRKEINSTTHEIANSFFFVVLSHGDENGFYLKDGNPNNNRSSGFYEFSQIERKFSNENCVGLSGKPKIFIYQACQGNRKVSCSEDQRDEIDFFHHPESDILVAFSTVKGYVSWRSPTHGERMEINEKSVITGNLVYLMQNLDADILLLATCQEKLILNEHDVEEIRNCSTTLERNKLFLDKIQRRPVFERFLQVLRIVQKGFIAEKLQNYMNEHQLDGHFQNVDGN